MKYLMALKDFYNGNLLIPNIFTLEFRIVILTFLESGSFRVKKLVFLEMKPYKRTS